MRKKRIGALQIGETPRPDLVRPLECLIPSIEIIQAGGLDGLTLDALPDASSAAYPLTTILKNQRVLVPEDYLALRLQAALDRLEGQGVTASILLCAGTFKNLKGRLPLIKPFDTGLAVLHSLGMSSIGLIAPFKKQIPPIRDRWEKQGFHADVWAANIENQDESFNHQLETHIRSNRLQCIVLDYVGHPTEAVQKLQKSVQIPVLDLGDLAMRAIAGMV